jgi:F-type H+-transporting ATPase subunit gamma
MANSLRDIRRKMKAIKSTRQVTKAMELVAASKMRRAVQNAQMLRTYALTAWAILRKVSHVHAGASHPFLEEKPVRKVLAIVFSTDRGLCGSLNTQLFRSLTQYMQGVKGIGPDTSLEFIAVGRKVQQFLTRNNAKVAAAFPAMSNHPSFRDVLPVGRMAMDGFRAGTYDHIVLVYTDFVSALFQEPTIKVLLPFSESELKNMLKGMFQRKRLTKEELGMIDNTLPMTEYLFEPSETEVLDRILPQLSELQIYQAALESAASEHSARMVAMRSASDNASDILGDLNLTYNQTRQANITAELAELSASKAALE